MEVHRKAAVVGAVVSLFAALALRPAGGQGSLAGFDRVSAVPIPLDGREVTLPLPRGTRPADVRIVVEGCFRSSYNGRTYFARGCDGDTPGRELLIPYVRSRPETLALVSTDARSERYIFRLPSDGDSRPGSVGAWVDIDRLVTELIITPSDVRASLTGDLELEVWRRPSHGPLFLLLGLVIVLALGGVAIGRVRRTPAPNMSDVSAIVRRIEEKYRPTAGAIGDRRLDAPELKSQLALLTDGARDLARHIEAFRRAARSVEPDKLDAEIREAEAQLEETERQDVRQEIEATLAARRKLRELLSDTKASEARYLQRLSKIEAAIDTTHLRLAAQEGRMADEGADRQAIDALTAELESLDRAIDELRVLDDQ